MNKIIGCYFTHLQLDNGSVLGNRRVRIRTCINLLNNPLFCRVFEFVPLSVTALLPAGLFPLLGILGSGETAAKYCTDTIMLLLGSEVR